MKKYYNTLKTVEGFAKVFKKVYIVKKVISGFTVVYCLYKAAVFIKGLNNG